MQATAALVSELVTRAQQGDQSAFATLYEEYSPLVYRFLRRRLDGSDGVGFNLRPPAGARLRAFTAARIGKPMAVVVDDRAHVFTVREAISDAFWLSPMDAGEARILAGRVNNCVTP